MRGAILTILAALAGAPLAAAGEYEPAHANRPAHQSPIVCEHDDHADVAEIIFHHVADDYTMEIPWFGHLACKLVLGRPASATEDYPSLFGTWAVKLGGRTLDLTPTKHVVFMWLAALSTFLLAWTATRSYRKKGNQPSGMGTMVEMIVQFIRSEIAIKNIGKDHADHYVPYLLTSFFFILMMNLWGLVPFGATATSNVMVTASLATLTFITMNLAGMRHQGVVGYWAHLVPAGVPKWLWPLMFPVEILGLVSRCFALTMRLFANMIAGHIVIFFLIALIFLLSPWVAPVSILFALGIFLLELFVSLVQAYIFTMLSALFIGMASHSH